MFTFFCGVTAWWLVGRGGWTDKSPQIQQSTVPPTKWLWMWLLLFVVCVLWRTAQFNGQTLLTLAGVVVIAMAISMGGQIAVARRLQYLWVIALLFAAVFNSIVAIFQYMNWTGYFPILMNAAPPGEAFGNLRQRNQLATLTCMGIAALVWGLWGLGQQDKEPVPVAGLRVKKVVSWLLMTLLIGACVVTQSRTGMIGVAVLAVLTLCWRRHLPRYGVALGLAAPVLYVVLSLVLPYLAFWITGKMGASIWVRLEAIAGPLGQDRWYLYRNVLDLIALNPWTGLGWRELMYGHYIGESAHRFNQILDNAHNLPLHLAVELGIPAAVVLTLVPLVFFWKAKPWVESQPVRQMAWAILAVVFLHSMVEYPLWSGPFALCLGVCLGILWPGGQASPLATWVQQSLKLGRTVVVGVCFLGLAWTWSGYYRLVQMFTYPVSEWPGDMRAGKWDYATDWPYTYQMEFYKYLTTPLTAENAKERYAIGERLMHYSPEARVITQHINAAYLAGVDKPTLDTLLVRFKRAYPKEYEYFVTGKAPQ